MLNVVTLYEKVGVLGSAGCAQDRGFRVYDASSKELGKPDAVICRLCNYFKNTRDPRPGVDLAHKQDVARKG